MKSIPFQKQAALRISGGRHLFKPQNHKTPELGVAPMALSFRLAHLERRLSLPGFGAGKGMLGYFVSLSMLFSTLGCLFVVVLILQNIHILFSNARVALKITRNFWSPIASQLCS